MTEILKWIDSKEAWSIQSSSLEEQESTINDIEYSNKLIKINTFLDLINESDETENKYREILLKLDVDFLKDLLNKPQEVIKQYLIQAQIEEIENSDDPDFDKLDELQNQLIAVEKQETKNNSEAIETNEEQIKSQLASIKGSLEILDWNNSNAKRILKLIEEWENDNSLLKTKLDEVIKILREEPLVLRDIAISLKNHSEEAFQEFKTTLQEIDPSIFDNINLDVAWSLAKIKLWTDNIDWVNLESDMLTKQEWDFEIKATKDTRKLNLGWSKYELESPLNSQNENELKEISEQTTEELKPLNEKLHTITSSLKYIEELKNSNIDFDDFKEQLKTENSSLYQELWLENKSSFDELLFTLTNEKQELEKQKEEITNTAKEKMANIIDKNTKEAKKADEKKKKTLKFFDSIWFDILAQDKSNTVIDHINLNKWKFGLQQEIDFQNWNIWFDEDFWNNESSSLEKRKFISLFNNMLWENVVNEEIANWTTSLSLEAKGRIQQLSNKTTGFFIDNLKKK